MKPEILLTILIGLLYFGCENSREQVSRESGPASGLRHAKRFSIIRDSNTTVVHLFGNRNNFDTTASFVLSEVETAGSQWPRKFTRLKVPCKSIAALSSIYAAMLDELGHTEKITGIDNIDYVNNPAVISRFSNGVIKELATTPRIDVEQTAVLKPDIIFTYGMGFGEEADEKLIKTGIPIAVAVDHLEETPLARAEWIKFFAVFVCEQAKADSIFNKVESEYYRLLAFTQDLNARPTVFSEVKFGDVWYMPGGDSYVATLLEDAGGDYLWKHERKSGSLPLSFEQVYAKARNADFWINLPLIKSKKELLSHEKRYSDFKAVRTGNLYNNDKVVNDKGYSIYWETGMIHPERILNDLICIFHPELSNSLKNDLYYYRQLK